MFQVKKITFWVDNSAGQEYEYRDGQPIAYKFSYIGRAKGTYGDIELTVTTTRAEAQAIMDIIAASAERAIAELTQSEP